MLKLVKIFRDFVFYSILFYFKVYFILFYASDGNQQASNRGA